MPTQTFGSMACWLVSIVFCGMGSIACRAQSIFEASTSQRLVALAEDGAARYLANEADLPDRWGVMSKFTITREGSERTISISGTQIYVCDQKLKVRRVRSFGIQNGDTYEYESLWVGENRWVFDETERWFQVYKPGTQQAVAGEPAEDRFGSAGTMFVPLFDPKLVWAVPAFLLQSSLVTSPSEYIRPDSIQATRLNRDDSVAALFAQTKTRGINYITEITFPRQGMPVRFARYASIKGDFDLAKAKEAQVGVSPVITNMKWVEYARDRYVPVEALSIESGDDQASECKFSHSWLLGSVLKDWAFQDPRATKVPLEDLKFDKPAIYTK